MDSSRFLPCGKTIPDISIGVRISNARRSLLHACIIYRNEDDEVRIVHFTGGNASVVDEPYGEAYFTSILPISVTASERDYLSAFCQQVATAGNNQYAIPYSIRLDPDVEFDETSKVWRPVDHTSGLSCATFVVVVFRSAKRPILDSSQWPVRPEDTSTQQLLACVLAPQDHPHVGKCPRIRPQEVAGAILEEHLPACFAQSESNGRWILRQLESANNLPTNSLDPR